jgi:hypothetical protein
VTVRLTPPFRADHEAGRISAADEHAKLELIVSVAQEIWG